MTIFFKSHEISIYRTRRIGSSDRYSMSATLTSYRADIQPASLDRIESVSGRLGATFTAYVDVTLDIKEGDQLVVSGYTQRFGVKGVSIWQNASLLDCKELDLESIDA